MYIFILLFTYFQINYLLDIYELNEFVAIDLEGTGLDAQKESLIEISAVKFINGVQDKGNGKLVSFESEYNITDNINILFGSTKIYGDKDVQSESQFDPGYTFNLMEDFSHNRIQLQYFFQKK